MIEHPALEHALVEHAVAAVRSALPGREVSDVEVLARVSGERLVFRCRAGGTQVLVRCVERNAAHRQFRYLEALSSARDGVLRVPAPIAIVALDAALPSLHRDQRPSDATSRVSRAGETESSGSPGGSSTADSSEWAVLVLEHLDGTACTQLLNRSSAIGPTRAGLTAMTLAGRALSELHAIDLTSNLTSSLTIGLRGEVTGDLPIGGPSLLELLDLLEVVDACDHLTDLVRPQPDVLAAALPAWAGVIERAVHHVLSAPAVDRTGAGGPAGRQLAVLHRDVHLRQMFVHDGRMGLVDWDLAAIGDPAFDVAYLTTHLATHLDRSEELILAVLDGYGDDSMTPERLAPFRSFNLLRRACRRFRLRDAGWEAELQRMLSMLADTLDETGVPGAAGVSGMPGVAGVPA